MSKVARSCFLIFLFGARQGQRLEADGACSVVSLALVVKTWDVYADLQVVCLGLEHDAVSGGHSELKCDEEKGAMVMGWDNQSVAREVRDLIRSLSLSISRELGI